MPYIDLKDRQPYQDVIDELAKRIPGDRMLRPGHLNYVISLLLEKVYGNDMRYADHNEVIGMLNCVALEFYRRKTAPYEDEKIRAEGDLTAL